MLLFEMTGFRVNHINEEEGSFLRRTFFYSIAFLDVSFQRILRSAFTFIHNIIKFLQLFGATSITIKLGYNNHGYK
jgi:hypothetical protein